MVLEPRRASRLVLDAVQRLHLDLGGLTVLTEAGSNAFAVTPAIAAAAGAARVYAVTRESRFGSIEDVHRQAAEVARYGPSADRIHFVRDLPASLVAECDIVTNLGFVRPIDARLVAAMKDAAVVPLMCEAWEFRPGDVDLAACTARGIPVAGTDEHREELPVFRYSGIVAVRLLLDAGLEIRGMRIAVLGWDAFATEIAAALTALGATVQRVATRTHSSALEAVRDSDVVLVADYEAEDVVVGDSGLLTPGDIAAFAPGATVVQFAGAIDAGELAGAGIAFYPPAPVPAKRMSYTLGVLGPRPVIWLHAAGLKVGELLSRERRAGFGSDEAVRRAALRSPLVQPLTAHPQETRP